MLEERDWLERLGMDEKIILKYILKSGMGRNKLD
jgi:hypothetical protein